MRLTKVFLLLLIVFQELSGSSWAQSPMEQTTALLNSPSARNEVTQKDAKAKMADDRVKSLGLSSQGQEGLYQVSGKIFESLTLRADGDVTKMNDQIQGYMRDPASIEKDLTPEMKAQIYELSLQMPGSSDSKIKP